MVPPSRTSRADLNVGSASSHRGPEHHGSHQRHEVAEAEQAAEDGSVPAAGECAVRRRQRRPRPDLRDRGRRHHRGRRPGGAPPADPPTGTGTRRCARSTPTPAGPRSASTSSTSPCRSLLRQERHRGAGHRPRRDRTRLRHPRRRHHRRRPQDPAGPRHPVARPPLAAYPPATRSGHGTTEPNRTGTN